MLTAAHCIEDNNPSKNGCVAPIPGLRIILGEFDMGNIGGHEVRKSKSRFRCLIITCRGSGTYGAVESNGNFPLV